MNADRVTATEAVVDARDIAAASPSLDEDSEGYLDGSVPLPPSAELDAGLLNPSNSPNIAAGSPSLDVDFGLGSLNEVLDANASPGIGLQHITRSQCHY